MPTYKRKPEGSFYLVESAGADAVPCFAHVAGVYTNVELRPTRNTGELDIICGGIEDMISYTVLRQLRKYGALVLPLEDWFTFREPLRKFQEALEADGLL